VRFFDHPSSICLFVRLLHFWLLQNHKANFNQTWHKSSFGGFKIFHMKGNTMQSQFQSNLVQTILGLKGNSKFFKYRTRPSSRGRYHKNAR
jgi:hypothetical protein